MDTVDLCQMRNSHPLIRKTSSDGLSDITLLRSVDKDVVQDNVEECLVGNGDSVPSNGLAIQAFTLLNTAKNLNDQDSRRLFTTRS